MGQPLVDVEAIRIIASSLRADSDAGTFCFNTDKAPLAGGQCQIYVIRFDHDVWAVRVPVYMAHLEPSGLAQTVQEEVDILQTLQQSGFRWSPRLIAFDINSNNALGWPYIIYYWIHGKPLTLSHAERDQQEVRDKIVRQIMEIIIELARCTAYSESCIGERSLLS